MAEPPPRVERDPLKGFLYAASAAVVLSFTTYIFSKYAMDKEEGLNAATFAFFWTLSASVYLLLLLAARGKLGEIRLPRRVAVCMVAVGITGGLAHIFFWSGLALLNPTFTSFLMRFMSVLVILGCVIFLRERLSRSEVIAIAVMLVGGCICFVGKWEFSIRGAALILLCTVAGAAWRLLAKAGAPHVPPMAGNFYRCAVSAALIGLWAWATGGLDLAAEPSRWAAVFLGALLGPCIAMSLMFASYRYWDLSKTSMVVMAQPLIVLPAALVLPGPALELQQLIGGMIILAGGLWLVWMHQPSARRRPDLRPTRQRDARTRQQVDAEP